MQFNLHKINYWRLFGIILLIAVILLSYKTCSMMKEVDRYEQNEKVLEAGMTTYKLKSGNQAITIGELQYTEKELRKKVIDKDAELREMAKKFSSITGASVIKTTTTIPKIGVAFDSPIIPKDTTGGKKPCPDYVFEPKKGSYFSEWYNLGYEVTNDSLIIEPFNTWTDMKRIDGMKKKWFLGRATPTTDLTFTNPFVTANEVKVIVVPYKVPIYDTRLFNIGVGVLFGALIIN